MSEDIKNKLFALLPIGMGAFIIGLAIWGDDGGMHAPRWVIAAAGGVFLLAGLTIRGQGLPWFSAFAGALMVTLFGAAVTWVSFGPGEREFTSTVSLPFLTVSGPGNETFGRLCFAPGAILLDILAVYLWVRLLLGKTQ
jgi:hypothetical protein